ncbi:FAR-17a/AIG1-like protein [Gongronella butleri]|nr:FAR-17a/AIG1-like protein [Gongronella butleri]
MASTRIMEHAFALFALGVCIYGYVGIHQTISMDIGFGGQYQFVTMWLLTLTMASFGLKLIGLPCTTLINVATAMETGLSCFYWWMVLSKPHLVPARDSPFYIPMAIDLALHLWPSVLLHIDLVLFRRGAASTHVQLASIAAMYALAAAYCAWSGYTHQRNEYWAYPLFADLSTAGRLGFLMACTTGCTLVYLADVLVVPKLLSKPKNE